MNKEKPTLLQYLNSRKERAEKFTSDEFINQVKLDIESYEAKMPGISDVLGKSNTLQKALNYRYDYTIPMVFTNTEAAKASLFERLPDLIIRARGKDDDDKSMKINAVYEYLKDKLDLDTFAWTSAHWFILSGFVSATIGYKTEAHKEKVYDETTQEVMLDEMGEEVTQEVYDHDDPTIKVDDPLKTWFAPSSKFDVDAKGVDYKIWWDALDSRQIERDYGEKVEGNYEEENISDSKENSSLSKDYKKVKTFFYCGTLPEDVKEEVEGYDEDSEFYIIFTESKVLYTQKKLRKSYKLCRWYANPNDFFGYGYGRIGTPFQREKSVRVGQRIRLADIAAYPKYTVKNDGKNKIDPNKLKDPRENIVLPYETEAPGILQPGNLSGVVTEAEQSAESDAQSAFGLLDISSGAQESSTVDTATGQTIFAEASQRRIKQAKRIFMKYYRACLIELFKQCQDNWDSEKLVTITDDEGNSEEITVTKEDLKGIDFDKDLDIDAESVSVNKDVVREQMISLYDKVKDDPLIERKTIFKDMLRRGFEITNPDRYIKQSEIPAGTPLVNPSTGEQYIIDEGGELVPASQMAETAPSSPDQAPQQTPMPGMQSNMTGGQAGSPF